MSTNREQLIELLKQQEVQVLGPSENFDGSKGGIWISGEGCDHRINYWSENSEYVFGIHPDLNKIVEDQGWFFEWQDAGTLMCWTN